MPWQPFRTFQQSRQLAGVLPLDCKGKGKGKGKSFTSKGKGSLPSRGGPSGLSWPRKAKELSDLETLPTLGA